jgi:glyoxylase-like metal-dependent hydrolase (beta-lactamase superfamily II)
VSGHGRGWQEVGDRVFRFRYRSLDLNVGAVLGTDEVLVVDTRSFAAQAAELLADLRRLTPLPCRQVVNTHAHFDHCFGNATLRPAAIWGHERAAAHLRRLGDRERSDLLDWLPDAAAELDGLVLDPPDRLVGDAGADLEVGGRRVELRFSGRGHTDHDLVVVVPDAGVAFWGDLVEEGAPPVYADDAFPLQWPATLDRLLAWAPTAVVPGHGDVVGHGFVRGQREELAAMAGLCRRVAAGELAAEAAVAAAPFPAATARDALALVAAGRVSS